MQNIRVKEHHRKKNSHPPKKYDEDMISPNVFFFERTLIFGLNNFLHEHDCHQKFWAQIREEHLNSGRWNLLPGGKLNITLFEANFILRLEGPKTGWDGVVLKGWDMGWDGWVSKRCGACVCC